MLIFELQNSKIVMSVAIWLWIFFVVVAVLFWLDFLETEGPCTFGC